MVVLARGMRRCFKECKVVVAVLWCAVLGGERVWWRTAVLLPERKVRTVDGVVVVV